MTHFHDTEPVARNSHTCDMCHRTIRPGEKYRRSAGMDGSSAWTWKECAHCAALATVAWRRSHLDEGYNEDLFADFEPWSVAEARVRAQVRRRWTRRDGSLYPVPVVEWAEDKHGFRWPTTIAPGSVAEVAA